MIFDREKSYQKIQLDYCLEKLQKWYLVYRYVYGPQALTIVCGATIGVFLIDYYFVNTVVVPLAEQAIKPDPFLPSMTAHFKIHFLSVKATEENVY